MRVVIDTNVLLSACLKPEGLEAHVVSMARRGEVDACVTPEIRAEYQEVLFRDKFAKFRTEAELILQSFDTRATRIAAGQRLEIASDEDDNRFLECASAANAEYLITGNLRHYPSEFGGTRMVNARAFLESVTFQS